MSNIFDLLTSQLRFEQMKGVGSMDINFESNKTVYTVIGENGIGKTKFLESIFSLLLITYHHQAFINAKHIPYKYVINKEYKLAIEQLEIYHDPLVIKYRHNFPVVYISAQARSQMNHYSGYISKMGNRAERLNHYLDYLFSCFNNNPERLKTLNMESNIEEWVIQRARSANPYEAKADNRQVELETLLKLLNKIDDRIDHQFLEIDGDDKVFIKIEKQKRELSELSSGFLSIFKILQAIIAGYSNFTNEVQIANIRGFVLIDEIESHLHNQWQVKIIPLLKQLFPNTTFFITTHSSLVISQLAQGEAYRLVRDEIDGVIYSKKIKHPSSVSFIDLLKEAFDVNLNQIKIDSQANEQQKMAKKALLELIKKELGD